MDGSVIDILSTCSLCLHQLRRLFAPNCNKIDGMTMLLAESWLCSFTKVVGFSLRYFIFGL